jgi:hypothetical protein
MRWRGGVLRLVHELYSSQSLHDLSWSAVHTFLLPEWYVLCRHMQDDLAHALIDMLEYTSNQISVYLLRQESAGKLQTLQGAGHFRHMSNVLQTLHRLVS